MKPFVCERPSCTKRFWTSQHLRAHHSWHDGAKTYKVGRLPHLLFDVSSSVISSALNPTVLKHLRSTTSYVLIPVPSMHHQVQSLLYAGIMVVKNPLIRLSIYGPTRRFMTVRVGTSAFVHACLEHVVDKRYTCVHINCVGGATFFSTWSALQSHIRINHPPACMHPSCNGRTFATQGNLRAHIKLHDERDAELQLEATQHLGQNDGEPLKKKRRGGDQGRDWLCDVLGCDKDFKSVRFVMVVIFGFLPSRFDIRKRHWPLIPTSLTSENVILFAIIPTATRPSAINIFFSDI